METPPHSDEEFRRQARRWLEANAEKRPVQQTRFTWGVGSDSVALFQNLPQKDERDHIDAHRSWVQRKDDAGFANLTWDVKWGGRGLDPSYARVFAAEESEFVVPPRHEVISITVDLVAPTILRFGSADQQDRFIARALRTEDLWCQLFSEPGAGSDLAAVSTSARRDGDEWVLSGQKVWTSGAQFSQYGLAICRSDRDVPKHRGMTAFLVPMELAGVEVRPLRQATGGSSFNEVFLDEVRVPDRMQLGAEGDGWRVALTTLGLERGAGGAYGGTNTFWRLAALAAHRERTGDPAVRQDLAHIYTHQRLQQLTSERVRSTLGAGDVPGPEASIGKLFWTNGLQATSQIAARLVGAALTADDGTWGTFAWNEHVMGTAGYRIAGGTDEVQRNILAERVLGLPADVRVDKDVPFKDVAN